MTLSYTAIAIIVLVITGLIIGLVVSIRHSIKAGISAGIYERDAEAADRRAESIKQAEAIRDEVAHDYATGKRPDGVSRFDI